MINIFFLFSAYFSKTVGFGSIFCAEMNSACKNTLIRVFLWDLQKTAIFSENFRIGHSMAIFMLTAKKLIYTTLAIFGFFPSNKHDSFGFRKVFLETKRENHKKQQIMITNIFFLFSAYFSKTIGLGSVYSAEMNYACKNNLIRVFSQDLQKTAIFSENFRTGYSMAIFMLTAKKINIYYFGYKWLLSHLTNMIHFVLGNFA